jgi:hypothetical protein
MLSAAMLLRLYGDEVTGSVVLGDFGTSSFSGTRG